MTLVGCFEATRYPVATPSASAPTAYSIPAQPQAKLMIFGGSGHKVYLGCLNCSEFATDSIKNSFGPHGSSFATESIFNHFGEFGSPFSTESACNEFATDPPVVVDGDGNFYGRLTVNRMNPEIGIGAKLIAWLSASCQK
jgi:hypothetical protein